MLTRSTDMSSTYDILHRAITLLDVSCEYIESNGFEDGVVYYDDAQCDGACLIEDCTNAKEELLTLLGTLDLNSFQNNK